MKKSIFLFMTLAVFAFISSACGISALKPKPVSLKMGYLGTMALVDEGVPNQFKLCDQNVKDFRETLQNGFKHLASDKVPITTPDLADSTLVIDNVVVSCTSDQYFEGAIVKLEYKVSWVKRDKTEISRPGMTLAGSTSVKEALLFSVQNLYNDALTFYIESYDTAAPAK